MALDFHLQYSIDSTELIRNMTAFAFEQLTVDVASKSLTASVYAPVGQRHARYALLTCDTAANEVVARYRLVGTPTSTVGHGVNPIGVTVNQRFEPFIILKTLEEIIQFKFIRGFGAGTSNFSITYYR